MSQRPCTFFNTPRGCRRGDHCRFLHNTASTSLPSPVTPRSNSPSSETSPTKTPPGACNFYWTSGKCKREFACRFRHIQSSPTDNTGVRTQGSPGMSIDAVAPFLTADGLARVTGSGTDVYFAPDSSRDLSPTEAHNALKRYLFDDYRFRMTFDIYAFLKPLSSAHTANTSWVSLWL
jgi:hypothetical protein